MFNRPCIVVAGNLADGFTFYGPFPDFDTATEYADRELSATNTWIATLNDPTL